MLKMSWFSSTFLSDILKKRVCRYLLQRYLGQFLEEKLTLEQLNIDISNGTGTIHDVNLYCQTINELCEAQEFGLEVIGGHIGSITVTIPWNALMTEDSFLEVNELFITIRPHIRQRDDSTSVLESVWSSMSSSMQLAKECLETDDNFSNTQPNLMEGLEKFAQTIDNILIRAKARLINTTVRLEYLPQNSNQGIALIIKIENIEYQNEAGNDPPDKENVNEDDNKKQSKQKTILVSTYATHHFIMEGITFFTEEFTVYDSNETPVNEKSQMLNEQFYSTISTLPNEMDCSMKQSYISNNNENNENYEIYQTEPIMIAKLTNKQEIRIKMKQTDNISGPKVQLGLTLGSLSVFLSPRQLHLLFSLSEAFLWKEEPNLDYEKNKKTENSYAFSMDGRNNSRGCNNFGLMSGGVSLQQQWSSGYTNEYCESTSYYPDNISNIDNLSDSVISTNSSMSSSIASSATSQNFRKSKRKRYIDMETNADISDFNIRLACFCLVLLNEDILMEYSTPLMGSPLTTQSVQTLKKMSENYFNTIGIINIGFGKTDFNNAINLIDDSCKNRYIRMLCAPLVLDGEEKRNINGIQSTFNISIGQAHISEIFQESLIPILEFPKDKQFNQTRPDILINYSQFQKSIRIMGTRHFASPKVDINLSLSNCSIDFDISIIDRLNLIFNPSPFNLNNSNIQIDSLPNKKEKKPNFILNSEKIDFKLRFPIPDLRPSNDPNRILWSERNVRDDYLLFNFINIKFNTNLSNEYEIISNEINLYYCENDKLNPIHIGCVKSQESSTSYKSSSNLNLIKINLNFLSEDDINQQQKYNRSSDEDGANSSGEGFGITRTNKDGSPFTSKRYCRESDTPHNKTSTDDAEPMLIPGDKNEMEKFCTKSMNSSKIQIILNFPIVCLQLESKHLYEVIYNRINSDLLMWESSAPVNVKLPPKPLISKTLANAGMMDSIYMPYNSSSTSNSESDSDNDIYYSITDKQKNKAAKLLSNRKNQINNISFRLNIQQGIITMYTPVRDAQNRVIPGQLGEFVLKVKSAYLFSVTGYNGDENIGYVCLESKSGELYHSGQIPSPTSDPHPLRLFGNMLPVHLKSILYPIRNDLIQYEFKGNSNREMISLAIQIKANPELKRKRIRVSSGIQLLTLRHHFEISQHTWITQLTDMFDVEDYPVYGYTPYNVMTELHLHLWDCAIDYRPINFNHRAVITLESLTVTSNLTSASSGCTLRFVAEDCTLSLAPYSSKESKEKSPDYKITTLPSDDLVCVIDLGLFEISLKLNEKATVSFPKFDLRASINDVHIRTCSDSGNALAQFISYLASEGDFIEDQEKEDCDNISIRTESEPDLLSVKSNNQNYPEITHVQQQHVNNLMADAMAESMILMNKGENEQNPGNSEGVEIFFFPDETNTSLLQKRFQKKTNNLLNDDLTSSIESIEECKKTKLKHGASTELIEDGSYNMFEQDNISESESMNTEMNELLNFETSIMNLRCASKEEDESIPTFPQVSQDLGDVKKQTNPEINIKKISNIRKLGSDTDEDFCFIAEEEKLDRSGYMKDVPTSEEPIRIVDNHFSVPFAKADLLKAPNDFPLAVVRYTLCEMSLVWHIYGGRDFLTEEEKKTLKVNKRRTTKNQHMIMSNAYKMGVSFSKGSPKVQFGVTEKFTWKTKGGRERRHDILMEFHINKVRFSHETYPTYTEQASRQVLLITELEIRDKLEVSNINKFLYHPAVGVKSKGSQHMIVLKALHLRPDPTLPAQECCLRISMLPLRLNIDQDSLEFLITFFSEIAGNEEKEKEKDKQQITPSHQPPVMMVDVPEAQQELQARKMVSENLLLLMEDEEKQSDAGESSVESESQSPIYFRNIIFSPTVPIRIDYHGKHVEFNRGPLAGLIMGLGQLQCSEIKLKAISHRHGILGFDRLLNFILKEWLHDIKKNQLPSILSGVGPMHSLVQLFQGIRDLFWLPIEQYQKDGRIVRGIQLGAQSFTARTALAALELTTRLIYLLQITAETAYDMVSPGPSVRRARGKRKGKRKRFNPPQDIREGVTCAIQLVKDGIGETAHQIVEIAALEHDQKGYTGAVGAVVRQIPPTVVRPLVLVTQASSKVLGGVKNQLVPEAKIESKEKWKEEDDDE